jgi:hypothetical protein
MRTTEHRLAWADKTDAMLPIAPRAQNKRLRDPILWDGGGRPP